MFWWLASVVARDHQKPPAHVFYNCQFTLKYFDVAHSSKYFKVNWQLYLLFSVSSTFSAYGGRVGVWVWLCKTKAFVTFVWLQICCYYLKCWGMWSSHPNFEKKRIFLCRNTLFTKCSGWSYTNPPKQSKWPKFSHDILSSRLIFVRWDIYKINLHLFKVERTFR